MSASITLTTPLQCGFLSGLVEVKMSFVYVSAFILKRMSKITEVTLECQFIRSTRVH